MKYFENVNGSTSFVPLRTRQNEVYYIS